jgi:multiple sugar transport system permease protein
VANKTSVQKLRKRDSFLEQLPLMIMIAPFFIFFCLFTLIPIFSSIGLSFTSYDLLSTPKFIGIDNFERMFVADEVFGIVIKNTLVFAIIAGPCGFLLAFVLAWFVNEFSPAVRTVLSFMFYSPSLAGGALLIWKVLFSGEAYGYLNSMLLSIGVITEPIVWLKTPEYLMPIVIMVQLWQSMGVSFLSNISGLQNISDDLYEAGAIDGIRSRWQELRFITLPQMKNMLLFSAVMQIQSSFSVSGIAIDLAGFPSTQYAVDTIVSHMTDMATIRFEYGYASAIAVVLFIMMAGTRLLIGKVLSLIGR